MTTQPTTSTVSTRRNTTSAEANVAAQLGAPVQFGDTDMRDPRSVIMVCSANLTVARDFLLTLKETLNKRQTTLLALDLIQVGLNNLLCSDLATSPVSQGTPLDETKLEEIVKNAVAAQLANSTAAPTYGAIAARPPTVTPANKAPGLTPAPPKFKITVVPESGCPGINTAEDTKRLLQTRPPRDYGIRVDKIVTLKDNAILLESRCDSVLKIADSKVLKDLKLKAVPIRKRWPRMLISDVPEGTTQEQLVEELTGQNLPDSVPKNFIGKIFKQNRRTQRNTESRSSAGSANFVVEVHPAARRFYLQTGRVYTAWRSHHIRDFLEVTRCYNCQRYGHISRNCNSPTACGYCSSTEHDSNACRHRDDPQKHKCVNCLRSGAKDTAHHTAANMCPIYKHRLQDVINATLYDVDG
jgi:hypothetical protein